MSGSASDAAVAGPLSEAEQSTASVVADDKTTDEYEEREGEEPSVEQTDEGEEGPLSGEEELLQRGVDEDEEEVVSAPLSPAQAANSSNSSPSASRPAAQAGFLSSSLYASPAVSSITINPNEVDLGKVRFGPRRKCRRGLLSSYPKSQWRLRCEGVVQSLVMEDVDGDDAGEGWLAGISEREMGVRSLLLHRLPLKLKSWKIDRTAEPNLEEEAIHPPGLLVSLQPHSGVWCNLPCDSKCIQRKGRLNLVGLALLHELWIL